MTDPAPDTAPDAAPPVAPPVTPDDAPTSRRRSPYDVGAPRGGDPDPDAQPARPRPILERIGMAVIAVVLAVLFAVVGVAAFLYGEPFLGVMGLIGTLMVLWVGGQTLFRGR